MIIKLPNQKLPTGQARLLICYGSVRCLSFYLEKFTMEQFYSGNPQNEFRKSIIFVVKHQFNHVY